MLDVKDNEKEALKAYLEELRSEYYEWYDREKNRNRKWWRSLNFLIIGSSVITTILAALQTSEISFIKSNLINIQIILILVPLAGTAASTVLMQTKTLELYKLREKGREEMQFLIDEGRRQFAACKNDADFTKVHNFLISEVRKIEQSQASDFFASRKD